MIGEPVPFAPPRDNKVLVAGDWHGNTAWAMHVIDRAADLGIDTVLQLGDLGILWPGEVGSTFTFKLQRQLARRDVRLVFIDGNHDNHRALRALPRDGAGLGVVRTHLKHGAVIDRIRWIPRGHRWLWPGLGGAGVSMGALGGAFSVDYADRVAYRDWWPQLEEVSAADVLSLGDGPLEILVSHECPAGVPVTSTLLLDYDDEARAAHSRDCLRAAVDRTEPRLHLAAHWHQRRSHRIDHPGGRSTAVHLMDMDGRTENWCVVDLEDLSLADAASLAP